MRQKRFAKQEVHLQRILHFQRNPLCYGLIAPNFPSISECSPEGHRSKGRGGWAPGSRWGLTPWRGLMDSVPRPRGMTLSTVVSTEEGHLAGHQPHLSTFINKHARPGTPVWSHQEGKLAPFATLKCWLVEDAEHCSGCHRAEPHICRLWGRTSPAPGRSGPDGSRQMLRRRPHLQLPNLQRRRVPSLNIHLGPSYSETMRWSDAPGCQGLLLAHQTFK